MTNRTVVSSGILGNVIACVLSWIVNHSVGYAIIHFFLSWIYVIWWIIVHMKDVI